MYKNFRGLFRTVFQLSSLANQTKERPVHELFPGAKLEPKFDVNRACFPKEKHHNSQKMGEIHELFVLALSLVWFAGATPDVHQLFGEHAKSGLLNVKVLQILGWPRTTLGCSPPGCPRTPNLRNSSVEKFLTRGVSTPRNP